MTISRPAPWAATLACAAALASGCGGDDDASEAPAAVTGTRTGDSGMAVAPDGTAHAAWAQRHPDGTRSVMASARPAGGEWSAPRRIAPPRVWETGRVRIAVNARGDRLVSYVLSDRGSRLAQAVLRPAAGDWGDPVTVSRASGDNVDAFPLLAGDGSAAVASVTTAHDGTAVTVAARRAGGAWRDPLVLRREAGQWSAAQAHFAGEREACVLSAWAPVDRPAPRSRGLRLDCIGADGVPRTAPAPRTRRTPGTDIAAARVGAGAVAAWSEAPDADGRWSLVAARRDADGDWSPSAVIDRSPHRFGTPAVGADGAGGAIVAWPRWDPSLEHSRIRAAIWRSGEVVPGTAATLDRFAPAESPAGNPSAGRFPAPGEVLVASGPRPAVAWTPGGFPTGRLVGEIAAATPAGDGTWRSVALPDAGERVRLLGAAAHAGALTLAWARYDEPTGGDAVPVSVRVPLGDAP